MTVRELIQKLPAMDQDAEVVLCDNEHGDAKPFEPFDRYAHVEASKGKSMAQLLDAFAALRAESLIALESMELSEADFALKGNHPALGAVTLGELLAAWVVHDIHHVAQCCKGMSYQYRHQVGAWRA